MGNDQVLAMGDGWGEHTLRQLANKRVVTIGGGTGQFVLLSSLKRLPCTLTSIVSMADSGGSSRRLMDEFGQLPLGDLRQALIALSRKGGLWRELFTFRFQQRNENRILEALGNGQDQVVGLTGHSLGNLVIAALQSMNDDDLLQAIADAQELLDTTGNVLPVTLSQTTLCAQFADGSVLYGESKIDTRGERLPGPHAPIQRVFLQAETPACQEALQAIRRADIIVLGPGDLFTSIVPNLLVQDVAEAIRSSEACKVYVCNLMTKHGETDGFRASDFVREIHHYLGGSVDHVILHDGSFPSHLVDAYRAKQQVPVEADVDAVQQIVPHVIVDQLLAIHRDSLVRHDAARLARAILASTSQFDSHAVRADYAPVTPARVTRS